MFNLQGKASVTLDTFGGLNLLADAPSQPMGCSPLTWNCATNVGSVFTRPSLRSVFSFNGMTITKTGGLAVNSGTGTAWSNPGNAILNTGAYATFSATGQSQNLDITGFDFSLPSTDTISGVTLLISGFNPDEVIEATAQLLKNGVPVGSPISFSINSTQATVPVGSNTNLWGTTWLYSDINNVQFGVRIVVTGIHVAFHPTPQINVNDVQLAVDTIATQSNFLYVKTFENSSLNNYTLALDADGNFYQEDILGQPTVLTLVSNFEPGNYAISTTLDGVEYIALSDLLAGTDIPRQYNSQWIDRISQVGPGAPPQFAVSSTSTNQFPISTIKQNSAFPWPLAPSPYVSWQALNNGSSNVPGNVGSILLRNGYTLPTNIQVGDNFVITGMNGLPGVTGNPTFNNSTGIGGANPPYWTATYVSQGPGVNGAQTYLALQFTTTLFGASSGDNHIVGGAIQLTEATVTTTTQVPNLEVGDQFSISGASVAGYDNTWTVLETPNAATLQITDTSLTNNVATYAWELITGTAPTQGQSVTVQGTTNGNGIFNVVKDQIASITGTNSGTFMVAIVSPNISASAEDATATVSGTSFVFDPLSILGSSTGGNVTLAGTLTAGTRQAVVMFLTRNGFLTQTSPPITFTTTGATNTITASNLPLGPPNVTARYIAFTEAGQNGVPGAYFYYIPDPVTINIDGVETTYTSTVVNDNTSTTATFSFTDTVLLEATAAYIPGANNFNQIELPEVGWTFPYTGRMFYGLPRQYVNNFVNLTFDGGYFSISNPSPPFTGMVTVPAGWTVQNQIPYQGSVITSAVFGNSFYILNNSGATQTVSTDIYQSAYLDAYGNPIIQPNTDYSVTVTCRTPSGATGGALEIYLGRLGLSTITPFTVQLTNMKTDFQTFSGEFFAPISPIPSDLVLTVVALSLPNGADIEIDRIGIFPTNNPTAPALVWGSYVNNFEAIDGSTGQLDTSGKNPQPCNGMAEIYDVAYLLKAASMFSTQDVPNAEPADWSIKEVSNKVGAIGPLAYDTGEEWIVTACRSGVYTFTGNAPVKISHELFPLWESINWDFGYTTWLKVDTTLRRIYVAVPLPTPNQWLPDAPLNGNPISPNVILFLDYMGVDSIQELEAAAQMHVTMFGTLAALDMRRKWNVWKVAAPNAAFCLRPDGSSPLLVCNGIGSEKIYTFSGGDAIDDGVPFTSAYTTFGFTDATKAKEFQLLDYFRKVFTYMQTLASGNGTMTVNFFHDTLLDPNVGTIPNGLPLTSTPYDFERPLNVAGNRVFVQFYADGTTFNVSKLIMVGQKHPWTIIKGGGSK